MICPVVALMANRSERVQGSRSARRPPGQWPQPGAPTLVACWRIFRHFSHQAVEVRAQVGECGRQVGRGGGFRSSVGPGAVTFVVLGQDLHFVGDPGLQVADCGGGVCAGVRMIHPDRDALLEFRVPHLIGGDGWAGVGRGPPGYVEGGFGGRGGGRDCRRIGFGGRFVDVGDVDGDCDGGIDEQEVASAFPSSSLPSVTLTVTA